MTIIVNPFEGYAITTGGGWSASHLGEDYKTPRTCDYTAASDGVVISTGGTYNEIVVQIPDGRKWRMAEVSQVLVSKGQAIKLGQVIGRNALLRGGVYRSPHMNEGTGATAGRLRFSAMVTHTKAQAAAILNPVLAGNQRKTVTGVKARAYTASTAPSTKAAQVGFHAAGTTITMQGFRIDGEVVAGTGVWYIGTDGNAYWAGAFNEVHGHDLPDLTPAPVVVPPVVVVPEPPVVIPTPEPEPPVVVPEPPVIVEPTPVDPEVPVEPEKPTEPVDPPVVKPTPATGWFAKLIEFLIRLFGAK